MMLRQTPELKLKEIQQAFSEQNAREAQCREIKRICLKADKVMIARRRHLEAEGKIMYDKLQKVKIIKKKNSTINKTLILWLRLKNHKTNKMPS